MKSSPLSCVPSNNGWKATQDGLSAHGSSIEEAKANLQALQMQRVLLEREAGPEGRTDPVTGIVLETSA